MLAFEDEGRVVWFEGNYADYEADRKRALGPRPSGPHRLRHRSCARPDHGARQDQVARGRDA